MKLFPALMVLFRASLFSVAVPVSAFASECLNVTLTGTMGGPSVFGGLAGAGTLVSFGSREDGCGTTRLQFDVGRATNVRLSQLGVSPNQIDAVFFTHLHSDHTAGFTDLLTTRWHFNGPSLDVVCSADVTVASGKNHRTMSCAKLIEFSDSTAEASGEVAQRYGENPRRKIDGPSALAVPKLVALPLPVKPQVVWQSGDVVVRAIASTHIPGHLSYRVDTPAGSVVIGGDAGNNTREPPRAHSTSDNVELLSQGADILVHSVIHPIMGPGQGSGFPPKIFYRQSTPRDLGAMAKRSNVSRIMFTHMIPALGAPAMGRFVFPSILNADDYISEARAGGYEGIVDVGSDLMSVTIPQQD